MKLPCPKCGNADVDPTWHQAETSNYYSMDGRNSECDEGYALRNHRVDSTAEHLHYRCRCTYEWFVNIEVEK